MPRTFTDADRAKASRKGIPNKTTSDMKAALEGALRSIDASAELVKLCRSDEAGDRRTFWGLAAKLLPQHMTVESQPTLADLLEEANELDRKRRAGGE